MTYQVEMIPSAALEREAMVPEHLESMDQALGLLTVDPLPWMAFRTGVEKAFRSLALTRNVEIEYTVYEERQLIVVVAVTWAPIDEDCHSLTDNQ